MAFNPQDHFTNKVKGGAQYLEVKWRVVWLREEHPDALIETELVQIDLDAQLAIFRARVTIPGDGSATGYGSETERDFPAGWIEKAETKAVGRALALLGYGTQFAQEFDEGGAADSPVTPRPAKPAAGPPRAETQPSVRVTPATDDAAVEEAARLVRRVTLALQDDPDYAAKLAERTMTPQTLLPEQLQRVMTVLEQRAQARQRAPQPASGAMGGAADSADADDAAAYDDLHSALEAATTPDELFAVKREVGTAREQHTITNDDYTALMRYHGERQAGLAKARTPAAGGGVR